ncbi:hypothetical protein QBC43DRAFT_318653 [Cladorrhinum sp. PSN259]|nr:hypothetical protein QBC43DRAFT_318653 [Cladorrhinum sp. PSN259]
MTVLFFLSFDSSLILFLRHPHTHHALSVLFSRLASFEPPWIPSRSPSIPSGLFRVYPPGNLSFFFGCSTGLVNTLSSPTTTNRPNTDQPDRPAKPTNMDDLKKDLPMSMAIAAFSGISWYIGGEINTSLFILFKRRSGLYFWSAALASWGVILQPLFIILADFGIWTNLTGAIICIYLTWLIMVIPQSWLLYSRLHLIVHNDVMLKWLRIVLVFNSVVFSVPTIILGTIAQATDINPGLYRINLAWDRVQLTVFFVQETSLSLLYIWQARKYLRNSSLLSQPYLSEARDSNNPSSRPKASPETKQVLSHLVLSNILVIALDIALLGVQYADLFYLQGAFKPCVYGVKLKVEFAILNRLLDMVRRRGSGGGTSYSNHSGGDDPAGSNYREGNQPGIFRGTSGQGSQIKPEGLHVNVISSSRRGSAARRHTPAGGGGGGDMWEDNDVSPGTAPEGLHVGFSREEHHGGETGLQLGRLDGRPTTGPSEQGRSFGCRSSEDPIWDGRQVSGQAV